MAESEITGRPPRTSGQRIQDGHIAHPSGCPRKRTDCVPLSRVASDGFESYMCCGETNAAPVPTDTLRLCIKSTHEHGVDLLVNFDERDATDTAFALLGGLSSRATDRAIAERATEEAPHA